MMRFFEKGRRDRRPLLDLFDLFLTLDPTSTRARPLYQPNQNSTTYSDRPRPPRRQPHLPGRRRAHGVARRPRLHPPGHTARRRGQGQRAETGGEEVQGAHAVGDGEAGARVLE